MSGPAEQPASIQISASAYRQILDKNASVTDLAAIGDTLKLLSTNPWSGTSVPFSSGDLKDIFVLLSADKKWRIVYRIVTSKEGKQELLILDVARNDDM